jgi:large subunit ribosomal protein L22
MKTIAIAKTKYIRMSPRKVIQVVNLIRGKTYRQALLTLEYTKKIASGPIWQALYSAAANAKNLHNIKKDNLVIEEIFVTKGGMLKRGRPRQKGRVFPIQKKISHLTVKLSVK